MPARGCSANLRIRLGRTPMKCIVAAVDGSENSLRAVDFAAGIAKSYGSELVLLVVARRAAVALNGPELEAYEKSEGVQLIASEIVDAGAQAALARARARAVAQGLAKVSTETTSGDPAAEIIAF